MTDAFAGIPEQAFTFYEELETDNSRTWWAAHKRTYDESVRAPLQAMVDALSDEFGAAKLFRPHRDTRFHKGAPYKTHQGAFVALEDAIGYYLQVSASGLMVAGGWYAPEGHQVQRYRDAIDGPAGAELDRILKSLGKAFVIDGNPLVTRPRGVAIDHPRIDLMRNRKVTASRQYGQPPWVSTKKALANVRADWRRMRPMVEWLADHVGPASDPSDV